MILVNLMIQIVSGVIGGTAASGALRWGASGIMEHSLLGALGGVSFTQLLLWSGLDSGIGTLDLASIATNVLGGILGGGILVFVGSIVRVILRA